MATIVHLDSTRRDFNNFPNPAAYDLLPNQIADWEIDRKINFKHPRMKNPTTTVISTLNLRSLIIPYIVGQTDDLLGEPHIYVNIDFIGISQSNLINIPDGPDTGLVYPSIKPSKFVCSLSNVQSDAAAVPKWIHFHALYEQLVLADLKRPIRVQIYKRDGTLLTITDTGLPASPDLDLQTFITLAIQPYSRDADYSHLTE